MSFVSFGQLPNILKKKLCMKKVNSLISNENERRTFFLRKLDRKLILTQNLDAMRKYIHCWTCTPILVAFEQPLDVFK